MLKAQGSRRKALCHIRGFTPLEIRRRIPLEIRHRLRLWFLTGRRRLTSAFGSLSLTGFTMVEMMVVLSIFSVIMGVAYTVLSYNDTYRDLILVKLQLYRQNKKAMDALIEELQKTQSARVTITDNVSPTPDEIRFQLPLVNSIDAQYNIPWGARANNTDYLNYYIRYRVDANNHFVRDVGQVINAAFSPEAGTEEIKSENIISLQFTILSSNYIRIDITGQKRTLQGRLIDAALDSTVYLVN